MSSHHPPLEHSPYATDVDRFLTMVLLSGLSNFATLSAACGSFDTERTDKQAVPELCEHLIRENLLTEWKCGKLTHGKYKGFLLDGYKFLGNIGKDSTTTRYLVEEVSTGKRLVMAVTPPALDPDYHGQIRYELRDIND